MRNQIKTGTKKARTLFKIEHDVITYSSKTICSSVEYLTLWSIDGQEGSDSTVIKIMIALIDEDLC